MLGQDVGHSHQVDAAGMRRRKLALVLCFTSAALVAELIGAAISGSLALLADAGHALSDVAGLGLALFAAVLAQRPETPQRTWGYRRAEVLAAAAQAAVLLAFGLFVLVDGVRRLLEPPEVGSTAMLAFGIIGLAANGASIAVLASARSSNLNVRAAFLEVVNDALGSAAVIVAAAAIALFDWHRADAVASLLIGALILPRTWRLLRETVDVLLESTPRSMDLEAVRSRLLTVPHVNDVHDLHVTQLTTDLPVLTAHVVVDDTCFHDAHIPVLLDQVQQCLIDDFDVEHSTIQFERAAHIEHERETHA